MGETVPGLCLPDNPGGGIARRLGPDLFNPEPEAAIVINLPGPGNFLGFLLQIRESRIVQAQQLGQVFIPVGLGQLGQDGFEFFLESYRRPIVGGGRGAAGAGAWEIFGFASSGPSGAEPRGQPQMKYQSERMTSTTAKPARNPCIQRRFTWASKGESGKSGGAISLLADNTYGPDGRPRRQNN